MILRGREVEITEIDYGSEPEDTHFAAGYFVDTEEELTVEDLEALDESYGDTLYEEWQEHMQGQADFLHDYMKDYDFNSVKAYVTDDFSKRKIIGENG